MDELQSYVMVTMLRRIYASVFVVMTAMGVLSYTLCAVQIASGIDVSKRGSDGVRVLTITFPDRRCVRYSSGEGVRRHSVVHGMRLFAGCRLYGAAG